MIARRVIRSPPRPLNTRSERPSGTRGCSSLSIVRSLGLDVRKMLVEVTIGVQRPDKVDAEAVRTSLPYGQVSVSVVKGGLDVPDDTSGDTAVIASGLTPGQTVVTDGQMSIKPGAPVAFGPQGPPRKPAA